MTDTQTATETPVIPIGRIDADPVAAPNDPQTPPAALPTLNPADSPYQALNLPPVDPKQVPVQEQQPVQNLGAVSHGGAIAYMADQILRGAMQGYDAAQAKKADQFNKKLNAQQQVYNDQASQLYKMAQAGVDPNSQEFKDAKNRTLASWQAVMNTVGERIPQPKKSAKSKQGQANGTDQTSLLQRALDHKNNPQDALQAVYQGAIQTGPPVFHQIQPFVNPAYRAKQQQTAQTEQTTAGTQQLTAQNQQSVQQATADRNRILQIPEAQRTPDDKNKLQAAEDILTPTAKPSTAQYKEFLAPDGKTRQWYDVTRPESIPQGWSAVLVGAGVNRAPKIGWTKQDGKWGSQLYDPETNQPIPGSFDSTKVPPSSILSLFPTEHTFRNFYVDANGVRQEFTSTNTSQKEIPGDIGTSPTETPKPSAISHQTTQPTPKSTPASTGSKTTPIDYVGSPAYKNLVKQATTAVASARTLDEEFKTAVKQAAAVSKDPTNSAAAQGLSASYLKNVIGGHNTGVRINQTEWKNAIESRPWLQGIEAHFGPDGYMVGVVLTPKQALQMANEINNKRTQANATAADLQKSVDAQKATDMQAGGLTPANHPNRVQTSTLPDAAKSQLKEGHVTTFANGQKWTLKDGQPEQVQ